MDTLIESLTATVTAFRTWGEFEESMKNGYVPTLRTSESEPESWNRQVRELRNQVRRRGYRVWPETLRG